MSRARSGGSASAAGSCPPLRPGGRTPGGVGLRRSGAFHVREEAGHGREAGRTAGPRAALRVRRANGTVGRALCPELPSLEGPGTSSWAPGSVPTAGWTANALGPRVGAEVQTTQAGEVPLVSKEPHAAAACPHRQGQVPLDSFKRGVRPDCWGGAGD